MAVALLALFVALGGSGYAATRVNGRTIVDRSISGSKLKHNTLTGAQINESRLGTVPSASDADFLNGRPASAYVLADGGTAAVAKQALQLDGLSASAFLPAGGTAVNASALGGLPASAFLPAGGKAADADKLDGLDATAFAPARRVQGAGPVTLQMPGTAGQTATATLGSAGPFTLTGECANSGGAPVARVTLQRSGGEHFPVFTGNASSGKVSSSGAAATLVQATASGGLPVWDAAHQSFSVMSNPVAGAAAALEGAATAITNSGFGANECYLEAFAFAG
jgi:hypothetical protein